MILNQYKKSSFFAFVKLLLFIVEISLLFKKNNAILKTSNNIVFNLHLIILIFILGKMWSRIPIITSNKEENNGRQNLSL